MSRTLSTYAISSMMGEESSDYPILLLKLSGGGLTSDILISSDPTQRVLETTEDIFYGTISNSKTYYFIPFQLSLPDEDDTGTSQMSISFDNVGRDLVPAIRNATSAPDVQVDIVMSCSPNIIEASFPDFIISSVEFDELTVSGTLTLDLFDDEPFPSGTMTPSNLPGLF